VRGVFADGAFDGVEIRSGLRSSQECMLVFERIVNTVAAFQPGIPFCFNDSPEGTLAAVHRGFRR
jgi:hypothetical protein